MGRVHKKKLAEYAEAAENEELNKSNNDDAEDDALATDKVADKSSSESEAEGEDESNEVPVAAAANADAADDEEQQEAEQEENGDDDDFKSLQGDDEAPENNGKKASKRKAATVVKKAAADAESDDEPLNGGGATPAKRGRKPAAAKAKPTKGGKAGRPAAKGKAAKKVEKNDDDDDDEDEDEEEYEVKDIMDHKMERGVSLFLIRWKGYTKDDDTWEPEDSLTCPDIIEKFKKKQSIKKGGGSGGSPKKTGKAKPAAGKKEDANKEWEVDKIIDYAEEKTGRVFRIRWKGFGPRFDTWEPEKNLYCDDIIEKFMKRMKTQENMSFKELREVPKKTKRLVNETAPRTNYSNPIGRKSKRSVTKKRVYYGDSDE